MRIEDGSRTRREMRFLFRDVRSNREHSGGLFLSPSPQSKIFPRSRIANRSFSRASNTHNGNASRPSQQNRNTPGRNSPRMSHWTFGVSLLIHSQARRLQPKKPAQPPVKTLTSEPCIFLSPPLSCVKYPKSRIFSGGRGKKRSGDL